jgi:hypothetical protein
MGATLAIVEPFLLILPTQSAFSCILCLIYGSVPWIISQAERKAFFNIQLLLNSI